MRRLALSLLFVLTALSPALADDCSLKEFASLDMGNVDGRIVVSVTIGGKEFHFLVDTGGVYSSIDKDVASALGLTIRPLDKRYFELYDAAGETADHYADVQDFAIGPIQLGHFDMVITDHKAGEKVPDGVLAPDLLSKLEMEFDFARHKLNLFSQDHCPGRVVYWSPSSFAEVDFKYSFSHIVFTMTLDGHDVETILDTGSRETLLGEAVSQRVLGVDEKTPGIVSSPTDSDKDLVPFGYRFKSLSAGGLGINNPLVYMLADRVKEAFRKNHSDKQDYDPIYGTNITVPDLILGYNVISKMHLFVSYKERKLYFTAADSSQ